MNNPQRQAAPWRRVLGSATVAVLAVASSLTPAHASTEAAKLIAQMRQALGGNAWDKVSAIESDYTFSRGDMHGSVKRVEDVAAGRYVTTWNLPQRSVSSGFDGISAWDQNSRVYYAYGDEDARRGAENESYRVSRAIIAPDRHAAVVGVGSPIIEGQRRFDVLQISPEGGRSFDLLLDAATHLPARIVEQSAEDVDETDFSDYAQVDGVMIAQTISSDGDTWHATHIVVNPVIEDREFAQPLNTRPLHWPRRPISIPFRMVGSTVIIDLMIDGKGPFDAEFDSGGGFVISPSAFKTIGAATEGTSRARGGGEGFTLSKNGMVESVVIGGANLGPARYATLDIDRGHPKRVLIGEPLLQRAVVKLDFDAMRMTLTSFDAFDYRGRGVIVPFHFQDNQPEVLGNIDGISARMNIDTGDSGSLLLIAPFARKYRLAERYHATIPYSGTAVTATYGLMARTRTVQLDDADGQPVVEVRNPVTRISQQKSGYDANRYVSANIGIGILKQFNVTFDYFHRRIIFEKNHLYGRPDIFYRTGFNLRKTADGWMVAAVYPGGAAFDAGIKEGETIVAIDGKTAQQLYPEQLADLFRGPIGSALAITLYRDGKPVTINLRLRDVL